jgi:hypothetical protein
MANLSGALQQLREEYKREFSRLERLDEAILLIEGLSGLGSSPSVRAVPGRRTMSPAERKRIAEAQRARWAKVRGKASGTKGNGSRKRTLSPSARRRIATAQKERWAKFRAEKKKSEIGRGR